MELIGQGMEGAVYDLGDGRVRKTWFDRRPDDVRPLKAFLDELPPLPFRTPRIHAGFFDMYGPDARVDNLLLDRFERLGHDRQRMYLYRAAYAITTATDLRPRRRRRSLRLVRRQPQQTA